MGEPYLMSAVLPGKSVRRDHRLPRRNNMVAEDALRDLGKPIGLVEYTLVDSLPKDLELNPPSIKANEQTFAGEDPGPDQTSTETNP